MVTLKQLKAVNTVEDLEDLKIGRVICDVSHRGGGVGFYDTDVANHFKTLGDFFPKKFGAGCNYLGGGVRGAITPSGFSNNITGRKAILLKELALACVRAYKNLEDENEMNEELDEQGNINWEAMATNASRREGIVSAY